MKKGMFLRGSLAKQTTFFLAGVTLLSSMAYADEAKYSIGGTFGTTGTGATVSSTTDWSLTEGDQIQWRVNLSGMSVDDVDDLELSNVDYEGDVEVGALQGGLDWYPFSGRYTDRFFVSTGLMYLSYDIDALSERDQSFSVGNTRIGPNDTTRLNTEIDGSGVGPYLSLGWGNRIRGESGISFSAEVGVMTDFSDPDVKVSAVNGVIPESDLDHERKQIEDDYDSLNGFINLALTYQF